MKPNRVWLLLAGIILVVSHIACASQPGVSGPTAAVQSPEPTRTEGVLLARPTESSQPGATFTYSPQTTPTLTIDPSSVVFSVDYGSEGLAIQDAFVDSGGNALVVFMEDGQVQVHHWGEGWAAAFPLPTAFMFGREAVSVQPSQIIIAEYFPNENGNVTLWQVTLGNEAEQAAVINETDGWVTALRFSPDGETLAVGFNLGLIRLYRTSDGARLRNIQAFQDAVTSMAYSPDGRYLIADSFSFDPNTYVFEAGSGTKAATLSTESWEPGVVSFSPGGSLASATASDGTHIFSTGSWQDTGVTIAGVWDGAFTCDSQGFQVSAGNLTDFYSLTTGSQTGSLEAGPVYCLADGRSVVVDMDFTREVVSLRLVTP